jgi:hypothetical protein
MQKDVMERLGCHVGDEGVHQLGRVAGVQDADIDFVSAIVGAGFVRRTVGLAPTGGEQGELGFAGNSPVRKPLSCATSNTPAM